MGHLKLCFIKERPVNMNDQKNLIIISNFRSLNADTSQLHISTHPSCAQCGEVFMSEIELKKHMQTHEANIVVSTYQVTKYVQTQSGSKGGGGGRGSCLIKTLRSLLFSYFVVPSKIHIL